MSLLTKIQERVTSKQLWHNIKGFVLVVLFALVIRSFLVQAFVIPSGSMKPTILEGDYLLVTKYNFGYSNYSLPFGIPLLPQSRIFYNPPKRGEVVVFKYPKDRSTDYIKRVIGVPGDKVQIINSIVYINDQPLKRTFVSVEQVDGLNMNVYREVNSEKSYLIFQLKDYYEQNQASYYAPVVLGEGQFFMMGDNRDMSRDSRFFDVGIVDKSLLVGKAWVLFFSIDGRFLQFWKWTTKMRFERFFQTIK